MHRAPDSSVLQTAVGPLSFSWLWVLSEYAAMVAVLYVTYSICHIIDRFFLPPTPPGKHAAKCSFVHIGRKASGAGKKELRCENHQLRFFLFARLAFPNGTTTAPFAPKHRAFALAHP